MHTFIISQDGEVKKTLKDQDGDFEAFKYLLNHQGQSTDYALKWGGWKVEQIDQETNVSEFWKPYSDDLMMFKSESEKQSFKNKF